MYVALLHCVTCMPFVSLPHDHWVSSRTLFAVLCRFYFLHKSKSIKKCCMLLVDVGCCTPQCMLALVFLAFTFQFFALPGARKDFEDTSPSFKKIFPVLNLELPTGSIGCCELRVVAKRATKNQRQETSPM